MKKVIKHLGKTGTVVATLLTIIGGLASVYTLYRSYKCKNITGTWKINCHINSSTYKAYIGKSSGYRISFIQQGEKLTGSGEMFWIDDQVIPYTQHIQIQMEGIVDGEEIRITYTLFGQERTTSGSMKLNIADNKMTGVFDGTAANSRGTVNAEMLN